jgi:thiosulfate sulfurtransferase
MNKESGMNVSEINTTDALTHLETRNTTFLDIRDLGSYLRAHIPNAQHIGDHNIDEFIDQADKSTTVIVYCYHGNSSRGGAAHLENHGFTEVYSMSGGYAAWGDAPFESGPPQAEELPPAAAPAAIQPDVEPDALKAEPVKSRRRRLLGRLKGLLTG